MSGDTKQYPWATSKEEKMELLAKYHEEKRKEKEHNEKVRDIAASLLDQHLGITDLAVFCAEFVQLFPWSKEKKVINLNTD